jgi:hypothetical protein
MLCRGAGGRTQPLTCGAVMLGTMEHNMTASRRAQRMRNASVAGGARPVDAANESSRREHACGWSNAVTIRRCGAGECRRSEIIESATGATLTL